MKACTVSCSLGCGLQPRLRARRASPDFDGWCKTTGVISRGVKPRCGIVSPLCRPLLFVKHRGDSLRYDFGPSSTRSGPPAGAPKKGAATAAQGAAAAAALLLAPLSSGSASVRQLASSCHSKSHIVRYLIAGLVAPSQRCHAVRAAGAAAGSSGSPPADPFAEKTVYKDNLFDRAMIYYFSAVMSKQLGGA
jgi:hypothetical protein